MNTAKTNDNPQKLRLLKASLLGLASIPVCIVIFFASAFTVGEIIAWIDMFDGGLAYTVSFLLSIYVIILYLFILFSIIGFFVLLFLIIGILFKSILQKCR